jgi:hypothetical protein
MRPLALLLCLAAGPALGQSGAAVSAELEALAEADQADRRALSAGTLDWPAVSAADAARRARVEALAGALRLQTGADRYHAALVLQHGDRPYDYYRAYLWSRAAVEEYGYGPARWLVPRAYDRWQQSIGRPQVYGTQWVSKMVGDPDGGHHDDHGGGHLEYSLGLADLDAVTDEERARWGVRPAAQTIAFIDCMNGTGDRTECSRRAGDDG